MAKKSIKLPFVVEPRRQPIPQLVGSEESGQFEIMRKGFLTVAEKSFVQQAVAGDESVIQLQRVAIAVAKENNLDTQTVIDMLGSGGAGDPIFAGYEEDLNEVMVNMQLLDARKKVAAVSALMLFRVTDEWTVEDTMELHPDLAHDLYVFYLEEDSRSVDAFEAIEGTEEQGAKK